ncbi:hypothetical protein Q7M76_00450 [Candidatus Liberibacter asiaticus]|uniref:Lipoprotein n=3 Tax=Liberibacter asiaticus TaxID=34021 RepID=C6XHF0_LIBAP|nr:hypothetical protein [Candidatus Liberibacter asiaticus]ACT56693.1 hypothetical protein CLIBASIA_00525 [Candidatus Liberibacter asiaticus str. psy62]AGH16460.1 hypothetical protein WSI_00440 [Candidatus Liberibacter asiaticus str. gxpsy]ALK06866.1 hypothetical protein CD16_00450 [Candidatus Liberibacter asiaticus]ASK52336.1 hypothetical protein B2I23_00470 [Candidatus Liberibacter asiaticus]AWL13659.1 hypothetical protein DIC79_00485 [Candidatus Liberibacter asiaticus]
MKKTQLLLPLLTLLSSCSDYVYEDAIRSQFENEIRYYKSMHPSTQDDIEYNLSEIKSFENQILAISNKLEKGQKPKYLHLKEAIQKIVKTIEQNEKE